ncbi:MAG: prenyltransferase, partial [Gammaproteobacteria bacterium]
VDFVLSMQTDQGDICWASEEGKSDLDDSLITGSSSIYKSLECAESIFNLLNEEHGHLRNAKERLKNSIINKPERYDRTWESKSRYSMDWYYPILCGLLDKDVAIKRVEEKWDEFFVEGMGCKCVSEEPWVTIAESCELVMALMKIGLEDKAKSLFDCLHQWRDEDDGLYWTGYVYTDKKYWPVEKPTWTAGAVLLAADSLYKFTKASELFLVDET